MCAAHAPDDVLRAARYACSSARNDARLSEHAEHDGVSSRVLRLLDHCATVHVSRTQSASMSAANTEYVVLLWRGEVWKSFKLPFAAVRALVD